MGSALHLVLTVHMSVCEQLTKLFNIFASGGHISLKSFGDIPRMIVHLFQIILNFLYVCQSVSWLTSLLRLGSYRDISSSVGDISTIKLEITLYKPNFSKEVSQLAD